MSASPKLPAFTSDCSRNKRQSNKNFLTKKPKNNEGNELMKSTAFAGSVSPLKCIKSVIPMNFCKPLHSLLCVFQASEERE